MSVAGILLSIGLIFALLVEVIVYFKLRRDMENQMKLLEDPKAVEIIQGNKFTVKQAQERLEKHYKAYKRLSKGNKDASWKFENVTDPERLANMVLELLKIDDFRDRKKQILNKLEDLPEKRREIVLKQVEALMEIALNDDQFEKSLDLERVRLEQEIRRYDLKIAAAKKKLEEKDKEAAES